MKRVIRSIALAGLMCVGTSAWAIPFTAGFTLHPTNNGIEPCALGCTGTLTTADGAANHTGALDIESLSVEVTFAGGVVATYNQLFGTNTVYLEDGVIKYINVASVLVESLDLASFVLPSQLSALLDAIADNELSLTSVFENGAFVNTDWTVSYATPDGLLSGGGSHVTVPEPSVIALFGLGLVALGFTRRRKKAIA